MSSPTKMWKVHPMMEWSIQHCRMLWTKQLQTDDYIWEHFGPEGEWERSEAVERKHDALL